MFLIVLVLLLFRLLLNGSIPLMDKTEARYAEVARLMVETDQWIMPQIDYGLPFWAKPPLSTWSSALSFKLLGVHEFTARLPYFLMALCLALMAGKYARRIGESFWLPVLILFSIPEFFLHAGVVSTDMALAFCVGLTMLSFWETIQKGASYWKYLFFVGIGLGLLAKGPIVLILTVPPLFVWVWTQKAIKKVWNLFPWFLGLGIILIIALPWYYLAELQSPGFIDYFIIGEHFQRFFDADWRGDKYGFPKSQALGMVWLFLMVFALPWIQIAFIKGLKDRRRVLRDPWLSFLVLWLLWTPLFFSVSKSLIHPYIMPVMLPIALLISHWWSSYKYKNVSLRIALVIPVLAIGIFSYAYSSNSITYFANSDKLLVKHVENFNMPLYKFRKKSYSGRFYSQGALEAIQIDALKEQLKGNRPFTIIIKHRDRSKIPDTLFRQLQPLTSSHKKTIYGYSGSDTNFFKGQNYSP